MNLFARKAFEGLNVEANRGRGNPRQHGSRWAEWSQDGHDAIAFSFRRERYRLSVTGGYRGAVTRPQWNLRSHSWSFCSHRRSRLSLAEPEFSCSVKHRLRAPQSVEPSLC